MRIHLLVRPETLLIDELRRPYTLTCNLTCTPLFATFQANRRRARPETHVLSYPGKTCTSLFLFLCFFFFFVCFSLFFIYSFFLSLSFYFEMVAQHILLQCLSKNERSIACDSKGSSLMFSFQLQACMNYEQN